jgi:hypothetical protein
LEDEASPHPPVCFLDFFFPLFLVVDFLVVDFFVVDFLVVDFLGDDFFFEVPERSEEISCLRDSSDNLPVIVDVIYDIILS